MSRELTDRQKDKIALVTYATVSYMFAMFHNPKARGPKFEWSHFPDIAERHAAMQVALAAVVPQSKDDLAEQHAKETGRVIAERLIHEMTR